MGFLEWVLQEYHFPTHTIRCIMNCISLVSYQLVINGSSRGPKQGGPSSHYLYILALDVLLRNLVVKGLNKEFHPLRASRSGPKIPALAFADDCIIFSKADIKSIYVKKKCLYDFCGISRQSLNNGKSVV